MMLKDGWTLEIHNVGINSQYPATVHFTISPTDKALLERAILTRLDLEESYRIAIIRGSFKHYTVTGGS